MMLRRIRRLTGLVALLVLVAAGCGGGEDVSNVSPDASTDPALQEKAQHESEAFAERARKAEAAKLKGRIQVETP